LTDVFTKEKRSEIMSKIRSKSGLDRKIHYWLCAKHIRHEMHPKVRGNPDIRLKDTEVYVFLDSCFWHGCPLHFREPKSSFTGVDWIQKIQRNKRREMER
jgi:DNA mismatch endonuclease (patch repair protein)